MKSEIVFENNNTVLKINGKKTPFDSYRSFHPQEKYLKQFYEHGFRIFNVFPSGIMTALADRTIPYSQFGPVWIGEGEYNWDNFKKQTELFTKNCPDGYVALMIHLDTPDWFLKKYPDSGDTWEAFVQGLSDERWKKAAADYMTALMDKADELLPDRVYGYFLMAGGTTEWYTRELEKALANPTNSHIEAYRKFCGDDNAQIPDFKAFVSVQKGIFTEDENVINYRRFLNSATADTLCFFAKKAKEHCGKERVVCSFFGYAGADCSNTVRYCYNETQKVFADGNIDIITCPASYNFRKLNSTSAFRIPVDSLILNKKLYVHEIDSKTHLTHKNKLAQTHMSGIDDTFKTIEETSAYLRREIAMTLAKGQGYWLFDMFGGWFDSPDMMREIENLRLLSEQLAKKPTHSLSETALLIDLESNYYIGEDADYPMSEQQIRNMNLCGFPWDMYITDDLCNENFDFDRYKLYIFPNLFSVKPKIAKKIADLKKSGKSILFLHAPGCISKDGIGVSGAAEITGINLKECPFNEAATRIENTGEIIDFSEEVNAWRQMRGEKRKNNHFKPIFYIDEPCKAVGRYQADGFVSIGIKNRAGGGFDAYCAIAPLCASVMKEIANEAGVFSYIDSGDVVYLNSSMLCVYALSEGLKRVYWPYEAKAYDYFTGESFKLNTKGTDIEFKKYETRIFIVE